MLSVAGKWGGGGGEKKKIKPELISVQDLEFRNLKFLTWFYDTAWSGTHLGWPQLSVGRGRREQVNTRTRMAVTQEHLAPGPCLLPILAWFVAACLSFISSPGSLASCAWGSSFPACSTFISFPCILTLGLSSAKPSNTRKWWPGDIHPNACGSFFSQRPLQTFQNPSNFCPSNCFHFVPRGVAGPCAFSTLTKWQPCTQTAPDNKHLFKWYHYKV